MFVEVCVDRGSGSLWCRWGRCAYFNCASCLAFFAFILIIYFHLPLNCCSLCIVSSLLVVVLFLYDSRALVVMTRSRAD
ncbi:hypothetical protein K469DRAFT_154157 [Zopfia rhizophila CBS 207.26]|uniref:Uncharacterized protein n=1 Tax=Zopfia rhizophila CBS 207.26 TaxID=1314779 RepID=A0A6A6E6N6_9PEZI|nr:hypothetical protein K469DRAFT_154157 [Zopfia rhizophila CBS 207.26]